MRSGLPGLGLVLLAGAAVAGEPAGGEGRSKDVEAAVRSALTPFWRTRRMEREGLFFAERREGDPRSGSFSRMWSGPRSRRSTAWATCS